MKAQGSWSINDAPLMDIAFHNCMVPFWDQNHLSKGWLTISDGRIEGKGKGDLPGHELGIETVNVDLEGAMLLPGLVDAHMHLYQWSISRKAVDLSTSRSSEEVLDLMEKRSIHPELDPFLRTAGFLFGVDYDGSRFMDGDRLSRELIDERIDNIPVMIRRICGHRIIINTMAMELLDLERTPDNDGILLEEEAMRASWSLRVPEKERLSFLREAIDQVFSYGITGGVDIIPQKALEDQQEAFNSLDLVPTIATCVQFSDSSKLEGPFKGITSWEEPIRSLDANEKAPVLFSKYFTDGSIGARTASFQWDYRDHAKERTLLSAEDLHERMTASLDKGLLPMVHAIGDRAVACVLDAMDGIQGPVRIEHLEAVADMDIPRLDDGRIAICMQPNFQGNWGGPGGLYDQTLGSYRTRLNRFRTVWERNRRLCFGSDMMPIGPMYGIQCAQEHQEPRERLSFIEALRSYSSVSAKVSFPGSVSRTGLELGEGADIAVYGKSDRKASLTLLAGRVVHLDPGMERFIYP